MALAQIDVSTAQPDLTRSPDFQIVDGELQLTLDQAIAIALQRNLDLVILRTFTEEAELAITQSVGIYDVLAEIGILDISQGVKNGVRCQPLCAVVCRHLLASFMDKSHPW